jgi:hypothetical protein
VRNTAAIDAMVDAVVRDYGRRGRWEEANRKGVPERQSVAAI